MSIDKKTQYLSFGLLYYAIAAALIIYYANWQVLVGAIFLISGNNAEKRWKEMK
jgi:hypothetical protein